MSITRRMFMKNSAMAMVATTAVPAFLTRAVYGLETNGGKKRLVIIFQRGAADGLNIVVPHGEAAYYNLRPTIAIPRPNRGQESCLDLDGFFGFHPALAPLKPLWDQRHLAAVHACGSPDGTRSHFDAQDYMESGTPGNKRGADGWLARAVLACPEDRAKLAGAASPFRAVALGGDHGLPRSLQGDAGALAIPDLQSFGIGTQTASMEGARRAKAGKGKNAARRAMADASPRAAGAPSTVVDGFETLYDSAVG